MCHSCVSAVSAVIRPREISKGMTNSFSHNSDTLVTISISHNIDTLVTISISHNSDTLVTISILPPQKHIGNRCPVTDACPYGGK